jgi:hypothetical protein
MTFEERRKRYPHGELIVPGGHVMLRSIYQFKDSTEVYAFLHGCRKECCGVCFQNEDICVNKDGKMNVPEIAIAVFMHLKECPKMVEDYIRFMLKSNSREWSLDQVEVI